jgi:peroxiredoxin
LTAGRKLRKLGTQFCRTGFTLSSKFLKILTVAAVLGGAAWIWLSKAIPGSTTYQSIPAPQRGFQAPDFALNAADGKTYRLSDLRGRPVLINFWASWCTPCRAEMPAIERVYRQFQGEGFLVLAINATSQDSRSDALQFVDQLELSFPILFDDEGEVFRRYQVRALPTSYFVDHQGVIQEVIIGGPMAQALLSIRVQQLFEGGL